jgi:hypothetical protein
MSQNRDWLTNWQRAPETLRKELTQQLTRGRKCFSFLVSPPFSFCFVLCPQGQNSAKNKDEVSTYTKLISVDFAPEGILQEKNKKPKLTQMLK